MKTFLTIAAVLGLGLAVFLTDSARYTRWLLTSREQRHAQQWLDREQRHAQQWLDRVQRDDEPLLPKKELSAHAPTTKRRVATIQQVPEDIRNTFLSSLNPFKGIDTAGLSPEKREWIEKGAAQQWVIKDRKEPWSGGCSGGEHFLEAGETAEGWWIFYEGGGIVDVSRMILIRRVGGAPKIVGKFDVGR